MANNHTIALSMRWMITIGIVAIAFPNLIAQVKNEQVDIGCAIGSNRHGNFCYTISINEVTHDEANRFCTSSGGSLAIIKDYETHTFLLSLRMRQYLNNYWFGLNDLQDEGTWIHDDNTKLSKYTNWGLGEPNSYEGEQDCANLRMLNDLTWDDESCSAEFLYICEFPESKCPTRSTVLGNICYVASHDFASYYEAKNKCKARGGQLALIKSKEIDIFIKRFLFNDQLWLTMTDKKIKEVYRGMVTKFARYRGSWIGLKYKNKKWIYVDNTTAYYVRWNDEVLTSKDYCVTLGSSQNEQDCGHIYSAGKKDYSYADIEKCYTLAEKWEPDGCSQKWGYICQYPAEKKIAARRKGQTPPKNTVTYITALTDDKNTASRIHLGKFYSFSS